MNPQVSIIILNWNGWKDTMECLDSLHQINYPNYDVIVVDNSSEDESINKINEYLNHKLYSQLDSIKTSNEQVEITEYTKSNETGPTSESNLVLIKNDQNYGFAEGNNIGIKYTLKNFNPDYILLLNNDTIVDKNFLDELLKVAENDKNIGSVQSLLLRPEGKIIDSMGQEPLIWSSRDIEMGSEYKNNIPKNIEIFGACAASALYRSETLNKIGLLDNDFFAVYEDIDLSWRIRLEGLKSILAVNSIVYHKRNISKKLSKRKNFNLDSENKFELYHLSKNMLIIAIKYHPRSLLLNPVYLYKSFLSLLTCFLLSVNFRKTQKTSKILLKNLKVRKELKKNPMLTKLQEHWIKN